MARTYSREHCDRCGAVKSAQKPQFVETCSFVPPNGGTDWRAPDLVCNRCGYPMANGDG